MTSGAKPRNLLIRLASFDDYACPFDTKTIEIEHTVLRTGDDDRARSLCVRRPYLQA